MIQTVTTYFIYYMILKLFTIDYVLLYYLLYNILKFVSSFNKRIK